MEGEEEAFKKFLEKYPSFKDGECIFDLFFTGFDITEIEEYTIDKQIIKEAIDKLMIDAWSEEEEAHNWALQKLKEELGL